MTQVVSPHASALRYVSPSHIPDLIISHARWSHRLSARHGAVQLQHDDAAEPPRVQISLGVPPKAGPPPRLASSRAYLTDPEKLSNASLEGPSHIRCCLYAKWTQALDSLAHRPSQDVSDKIRSSLRFSQVLEYSQVQMVRRRPWRAWRPPKAFTSMGWTRTSTGAALGASTSHASSAQARRHHMTSQT